MAPEKMQVIGAGVPRTGTFSTCKALEILLGGKSVRKRDSELSKVQHSFHTIAN